LSQFFESGGQAPEVAPDFGVKLNFVGICAYIVYNSFVNRALIPEEKISFLSTSCTEQEGINGLYWSAQIIMKNNGQSDIIIKKVYRILSAR
jgi:hypothetical protein